MSCMVVDALCCQVIIHSHQRSWDSYSKQAITIEVPNIHKSKCMNKLNRKVQNLYLALSNLDTAGISRYDFVVN